MSTPDSSEPDAIVPGAMLLGKYRIDRVVGVGGMGQVVLATHIALGERVAIKFLLPEAMKSAEVVERFRREAQATVRLKSEHACRVLDVGEMPGGRPFIVMEFLEGKDLAAVLLDRARDGAVGLPVPEAVLYVMQAAEALAEAHALGIIHRDIKPANLFRAKRADGRPTIKVLDFGIAKVGNSLTQTAALMGSLYYMSPEQAEGAKNVDPRSDVWSLSVVLYELLAGTSPFEREKFHETIVAILGDPPPLLREVRKDLPVKLDGIIRRGLAKDREQRIGSMVELAAALAPFAGAGGVEQAQRVRAVFDERTRISAEHLGIGGSQGTNTASFGFGGAATVAPRPAQRLAGVAVMGVVALSLAAYALMRSKAPVEPGLPPAAASPHVSATEPAPPPSALVALTASAPSPSPTVSSPAPSSSAPPRILPGTVRTTTAVASTKTAPTGPPAAPPPATAPVVAPSKSICRDVHSGDPIPCK